MAEITYTIKYQYGTYSGTRKITLDADDQRDPIKVMWSRMSRAGELTLGMALKQDRHPYHGVAIRRLEQVPGRVNSYWHVDYEGDVPPQWFYVTESGNAYRVRKTSLVYADLETQYL